MKCMRKEMWLDVDGMIEHRL
ncbi:uncharacterized protein FRV6_01210 [Fusarium oxysporum]|uniref:Uncharacterized protein n=2 Tax=Fusarium oxysporum TaxID=5507 RepID=A0A2H3SKJ8_FUSOX|nr:hypothetical protein FOXB_10262 [Fusarium oxysporum f. sp. conglutinans Fo5176]SCO76998.1 uncharacterized protein FRV6_01210 [Fusarium oxysporum]